VTNISGKYMKFVVVSGHVATCHISLAVRVKHAWEVVYSTWWTGATHSYWFL